MLSLDIIGWNSDSFWVTILQIAGITNDITTSLAMKTFCTQVHSYYTPTKIGKTLFF